MSAFTVTDPLSCAYTGRATKQVDIRVNPNAPARSFFVKVFISCILLLACLKAELVFPSWMQFHRDGGAQAWRKPVRLVMIHGK